MLTRSAPRTRIAVAILATVVCAAGCSSTSANTAPTTVAVLATQAGAVSTTNPASQLTPPATSASTAVTQAATGIVTVPAPSAPPSPTTTTIAPTGTPTVMSGVVMQIYSNLNFVISDGHVTLQVLMSPTTPVINLNHVAVPRPYIQVANTVQVTGLLAGKNLTAQQVLVPTTKDDQ